MTHAAWSPRTATNNFNLFGSYTHHSLLQRLNYDEDAPRRKRASIADISNFRSLNLGRADTRLGIWESFLEGAGEGLFSRIFIKEGDVIEAISGKRVRGASECELEGRYAVDVEEYQGGPRACFDMAGVDCCYTRFANDSLVDDEDNCRPVLRNGRPYLVAIVNIYPGDELTYSYDYDYWIANGDCLSVSARRLVGVKRKRVTKLIKASSWPKCMSRLVKLEKLAPNQNSNWHRVKTVGCLRACPAL